MWRAMSFASASGCPCSGMLRVFHKCGFPLESRLEDNVYSLRIPFQEQPPR